MSYATKDIRNIALLGHGGNGKSTLAESMLFLTGVTDRLGSTAAGNSVSDYDAEEIRRQISISATTILVLYLALKRSKLSADIVVFLLPVVGGLLRGVNHFVEVFYFLVKVTHLCFKLGVVIAHKHIAKPDKHKQQSQHKRRHISFEFHPSTPFRK